MSATKYKENKEAARGWRYAARGGNMTIANVLRPPMKKIYLGMKPIANQ